MTLRHNVYNGILANLPNDSASQKGYFDLLEFWEKMATTQDAGRDFSVNEFDGLKVAARRLMTPREIAFFEEPFPDDITSHAALFQAKVTGRLSKILMDRHGFKVPKQGGGLGVDGT